MLSPMLYTATIEIIVENIVIVGAQRRYRQIGKS